MKKIRESTNIKYGIALSYASIFISLFANIFLQRFINKPGNELISTQYNLYSFASSISSLLIILTLGLTSGYIRFATRAEKSDGAIGLKRINSVYALLLTISSIAALMVGTIITILFITGVVPLNNYSSNEVKLISAFIFLGTVNVALGFIASIFTVFLNYRSKFIIVRLLTLIFSTASPLISLPIISYFNDLVFFSITHIVLTAISLIIQVVYSISLLKYRLSFKFERSMLTYFKEVLTFTFFVFLVEIFIQVDANADKIILGFFAPGVDTGADASAVGSYNIAFSIVSVIGTSCGAVFSAFAPKINRAIVNKNLNEIDVVFKRTTEMALLVYFFIFGGFVSCGRQFVLAWLGQSRFYVYYIVIALLVINLIPYTINITSEIQRAYNKHKFRSLSMLIMAIFNVVFSFVVLLIVKKNFSESSVYYLYYQLGSVLLVTLFSNIVFNGIIMGIYNNKIINLPIGFYYKKLASYAFLTLIPTSLTMFIYNFVDLSGINYWFSTIIIGASFVILFAITLFVFNRRFLMSFIKTKVSHNPVALSNDDLRIVKKIELDILGDIIKACDELQIEYLCVGGTALGAVKYGGFIPWDDDIDIAMRRDDFDKFIKYGEKYLKKHHKIQSFEHNKNYLSTMAKVRDSRTTFDEISNEKLHVDGGVFVDIFPIDNAFDSRLKIFRYKYNYAMLDAFFNDVLDYSTPKTMIIDFLSLFSLKKTSKRIKNNIEILKNNKDSGIVYCRIANYPKHLFCDYKLLKFETLEVKVSKYVDEYLKMAYGDISIDPPEDKKISHHYVYNFDIEEVRKIYENSDD